MIPSVGTTAYFTFTSNFETLNGVYRIRAETTFRDAIAAEVNFTDSLYVPAGLSEVEFNADYTQYVNDRIVVLESVLDTETVYYVPESVFKGFPDPTIKEYFNLVAVINLGVFSNTQEIIPMLDQITDLVQASIGVTNPLQVITNPDRKVYLTDDQYQLIEDARQDNIVKIMPLSLQLKKAQEQITRMAAKLAEYEKNIATQASS